MKPMNHPSGHKDTEDDYFSAVGSDHEQDSNDEGRNNEDEDDYDQKKKPVKIKTIVRKPQPKLDPTRLCGERGLKCLLEAFENFKPKGDGHEYRDLDIMVSKYEYWAHRLFPKMKFNDVVERLEKLGEKREVKNMLHKLRLGDTDSDMLQSNEDKALEDEQMTETVLDMMKNLSDDHNSDGENDHFMSTKPDEEDDEDELFNRLLNTQGVQF